MMMEKITQFFTPKQAFSLYKILVIVGLYLFGIPPIAEAQTSSVFASTNQKSFFQAKNTFSLKEVLTDISDHYKVKIAYETSLVRDLSVENYPSFSNTDVVVVLKKVLDEVNLSVEKVTETILVVKPKPVLSETNTTVSTKKKKVKIDYDMSVTGTVRDVNNEGIPGVSVVLEGTNKGTVTDMKGAYQISVTGNNDVLIFSSVGMETVREEVGTRTTIDIVMKDETKALEMVVVSALGFTENRDKQGSTSSKVDPKSVVRSGESGLLQGLAGKAAGVRITRSTGDPGAGSNFQIRGANTITGASQPLIILDGIPISNSSTTGFGASATGVGVAQQSRLNDISPSDIESMQVLKGAAAAAMWGSRAANGVLVITTKKGKSGRLQVSYGMNYSIDQINASHPMQNTFGQGDRGLYSPTASNSWGDKIANRSGGADSVATTNERFVSDVSGKVYYPIGRRGTNGVFVKNDKTLYDEANFDAVFGNGNFLENTLTMSAGSERSRTFFSLSDINQKGIIRENSDYRRSSIRLNNDYIGAHMKLATKAAYILTNSNRIQQNSNVSGLYLGLLRTPPDFDNVDYVGTYYNAAGAPFAGRPRSYRRYLGSDINPQFNNPEWTIRKQLAPNTVHRFLVSSELTLLPTDWFDITIRGGVDGHFDKREYLFPIGTAGADRVNGSYQHESISDIETNVDVIGRATRRLSKEISGTFIIGYNLNDRKRLNLYGQSRNFIVNTDLKNFINAGSTSASNSTLQTGSNRGYTTVSMDYKNQLSINASGALEAASTIRGNFFYPSVDASWRFNKLKAFKDLGWLSLGKLRASWGQVGVRPAAYRFQTVYESVAYETYDDPLDPQFFGGGYRLDNSKGNDNLKPEIKTEWELGTDFRFLENRLSLSASYYNNEINDILLNVGRTPSSGFTSQYANAGVMTNKGWEVEYNLEFLKKGDLTLNLYGNANQNINKVVDLRGTPSIDLTGQSMSSRAVEGYPLGQLWGPRALRNASGAFILDANGYPQVDIEQGPLGDPNPRWRGGLGFSANYKKLDFNILFETSQGGKISQGTKSVAYNFGTHADVGNEVTLTKEMKNVAGTVYPAGAVVRGNIGNFGGGDVILDETWYTTRGAGLGASAIREFFVGDATWTRLREASLMYNINGNWLKEKTKLSSIQIGITGRNLFLWTPIVGFDPEVNQAGVGNGFGIEYFTNPSTRSVLFSLKVNY
jgi:TonB-linked SusC/RagA family outer membrane protein